MAEMGHTTPGLALSIYAHAMGHEEGQLEALRALVNGADWAASGQQGLESASSNAADAISVASESGE
jgi:hypothetical protein